MEDVRAKLEVTRSETLENYDPSEEPILRSAQEQRLEERFALALRAWDVHVASCPECLSEGLHLCAEGAFVYDDCEGARDRQQLFHARQLLTASRRTPVSADGSYLARSALPR